jgi:CheY-like chemotaxis protein
MEQPKILLVEDTEDDAFFFKSTLADTGISCECFRVCDGREAIYFLQKHPLDHHLVFLDLNMPVLTGLDVLEWLNLQWFKIQKEIVILSSSQNSEEIASARRLGAADCLTKPVSQQQLAEKIQRWATRTLQTRKLATLQEQF